MKTSVAVSICPVATSESLEEKTVTIPETVFDGQLQRSKAIQLSGEPEVARQIGVKL